jgi:hypothetical protein
MAASHLRRWTKSIGVALAATVYLYSLSRTLERTPHALGLPIDLQLVSISFDSCWRIKWRKVGRSIWRLSGPWHCMLGHDVSSARYWPTREGSLVCHQFHADFQVARSLQRVGVVIRHLPGADCEGRRYCAPYLTLISPYFSTPFGYLHTRRSLPKQFAYAISPIDNNSVRNTYIQSLRS